MKFFTFNIEDNIAVKKRSWWAPERDVINILSCSELYFTQTLFKKKKDIK